MQKTLKPCYFSVIVPWMQSASIEAMRDMVKLGRAMEAGESEPRKEETAQVLVNSTGRGRLENAIPCSGDRHQVDLLRNRSKSDQTSKTRNAERRSFAEFSMGGLPNTQSVSDYFRLAQVAISKEETSKVLTEQAKRRIERWQVRGPDENPAVAAQVMRSLRSICNAVSQLPTYAESRGCRSGGQVCTDSLYEFSLVAPKGARTFKVASTGVLRPSMSEPTLQRSSADTKPRSLVSWTLNLDDAAPVQRRKNKERSITTKIPLAGGQQTWDTTYAVMGNDI